MSEPRVDDRKTVEIARWLYVTRVNPDNYKLEPALHTVWASADALRALAFVLNQLADGVEISALEPWRSADGERARSACVHTTCPADGPCRARDATVG